VTLKVYNILGQKVLTLVDENQDAGLKVVTWDGKDREGRDLASGIYFYELKAGNAREAKRMVLLK
jgi:flagellar hook assembly protein FlgD